MTDIESLINYKPNSYDVMAERQDRLEEYMFYAMRDLMTACSLLKKSCMSGQAWLEPYINTLISNHYAREGLIGKDIVQLTSFFEALKEAEEDALSENKGY